MPRSCQNAHDLLVAVPFDLHHSLHLVRGPAWKTAADRGSPSHPMFRLAGSARRSVPLDLLGVPLDLGHGRLLLCCYRPGVPLDPPSMRRPLATPSRPSVLGHSVSAASGSGSMTAPSARPRHYDYDRVLGLRLDRLWTPAGLRPPAFPLARTLSLPGQRLSAPPARRPLPGLRKDCSRKVAQVTLPTPPPSCAPPRSGTSSRPRRCPPPCRSSPYSPTFVASQPRRPSRAEDAREED